MDRFDQIIGQSSLRTQLDSLLARGRVAHAYLWTGPRGCGKRTISGLMARALLCTGRAPKPCNTCHSCRMALAGTHPDLRRMALEKRTHGVDPVRELTASLELQAHERGRKIVIIEEAQALTVQAQNALLKALEEPRGDVVFFLLTDTPGVLLPTVRSRAGVLRVEPLDHRQMLEALERHGVDEQKRGLIAALSGGSVGRALELDGDAAYFDLRDSAIDSLERLLSIDRDALPEFAADFAARFDDAQQPLAVWADMLRDAAALSGGARESVRNVDRMRLIERMAADFYIASLMRMLKRVLAASRDMRANVSARLALDILWTELLAERLEAKGIWRGL